jgi:hypothetical protein
MEKRDKNSNQMLTIVQVHKEVVDRLSTSENIIDKISLIANGITARLGQRKYIDTVAKSDRCNVGIRFDDNTYAGIDRYIIILKGTLTSTIQKYASENKIKEVVYGYDGYFETEITTKSLLLHLKISLANAEKYCEWDKVIECFHPFTWSQKQATQEKMVE